MFPILFEVPKKKIKKGFNFATLTPGASATPAGVTVVRASVAGVENGDNAFLVDVATANQGRIGMIGSDVGLRVEGPTTNLITSNTRAPQSWSVAPVSGTCTGNSIAGPDGQVLAALHTINSGGLSRTFTPISNVAGRHTASQWMKQNTLVEYEINQYSTVAHAGGGNLTAAWLRYSNEYVANTTAAGGYIAADGRLNSGVPAGARDYYSDLHQVEKRLLSTYIAGTRAGEQFKYLASSLLAVTGKIKPLYLYMPSFSAAQAQTWAIGNLRLWTLDVNNYVEIIIGGADHRKVKVCVAGASEVLSVALPDWARWDKLRIFVSAGNGVPTGWYEHNGGARTSLGTGATPMDVIVVGGADLELFCSGTSNQLEGLIKSAYFLA